MPTWWNGRHVRFRCVWSNPWGFKSPRRQIKKRWFLLPLFYWLMWVEIETTLFGVQRISGRTTHKVLVRIARTLSLLEPKVLKRNCSSVEQIQEDLGSFLLQKNEWHLPFIFLCFEFCVWEPTKAEPYCPYFKHCSIFSFGRNIVPMTNGAFSLLPPFLSHSASSIFESWFWNLNPNL